MAQVRRARALMAFRAFYYIYERRLLRQIRRRPSPRHVGVILDGNRRHERSLGLADPRAIYRLGTRKLDDMLDWCAKLAIPAVVSGCSRQTTYGGLPKRSPASLGQSKPRWPRSHRTSAAINAGYGPRNRSPTATRRR